LTQQNIKAEKSLTCATFPRIYWVYQQAVTHIRRQLAPKVDLWTFGLSMYASAITAALSQQLPRGTYVKWDTDKMLEVHQMSDYEPMPQQNTQEENAND
jgi:hypothetical protein